MTQLFFLRFKFRFSCLDFSQSRKIERWKKAQKQAPFITENCALFRGRTLLCTIDRWNFPSSSLFSTWNINWAWLAKLLKIPTEEARSLSLSTTDAHCGKIQLFCSQINFHFHLKKFFFASKNQIQNSRKIVDFLWWKTRENVVVLDFFAVDNFDFTRKIVDFFFFFGEKLVKMLWF